MNGDTIKHDNGRVCKQFGDVWYINEVEGIGYVAPKVCQMDHPMHLMDKSRASDTSTVHLTQFPIASGELEGSPPIGEWHLGPGAVIPPIDQKWSIDSDGVHIRGDLNGLDIAPVTDDAKYILDQLPTIIGDFLDSNAKYARAQTGHDLGPAGIMPDINRKTSVLISRIWHGEPAGRGESTEEVIGDLIGHLLLLLAKRTGDSELQTHHPYRGSV